MPDIIDYANEFAKQVDKEMKETPTIDDIGNESYFLYLHYKKDNHVLFIGSFAATGWIKSITGAYLENDSPGALTFTMVEV